jgi:hypothetical protein
MASPHMALRDEHAQKERDHFIAHALEALSQSAPEAQDTPIECAPRDSNPKPAD